MSGIGDRIKLARQEAGLTQQELADLMHRRGTKVTRAAISQWERGETMSLKPENLFTCADVLGVMPRWLGTGNGPRCLGSPSTHPYGPLLIKEVSASSELDRKPSQVARALAEEIINDSADGRVDDRVLDLMRQLIRELGGRRPIRDIPPDSGYPDGARDL